MGCGVDFNTDCGSGYVNVFFTKNGKQVRWGDEEEGVREENEEEMREEGGRKEGGERGGRGDRGGEEKKKGGRRGQLLDIVSHLCTLLTLPLFSVPSFSHPSPFRLEMQSE